MATLTTAPVVAPPPATPVTPADSRPTDAAHGLTPEQVERIGDELEEIRQSVIGSLGERDAAYIRRVIRVERHLRVGSRAVLVLGARWRPAWVVGTAGLEHCDRQLPRDHRRRRRRDPLHAHVFRARGTRGPGPHPLRTALRHRRHLGLAVRGHRPVALGIDAARSLWIAFLDTPADGVLAVMVGGPTAGWDDALTLAEPILESIRIDE